MIHYSNKEMEMVCDDCGEVSIFYGSWAACIEESKQEGWKARKLDEEWLHKCTFCLLGMKNPVIKPTNIFPEIDP